MMRKRLGLNVALSCACLLLFGRFKVGAADSTNSAAVVDGEIITVEEMNEPIGGQHVLN